MPGGYYNNNTPYPFKLMTNLLNSITNLFMYIMDKTTSNDLIMLFWAILIIYGVIYLARHIICKAF